MARLSEWLINVPYTVLRGDPAGQEVEEVVFDSKKALPGTVFVCMKGANVDSHRFLPEIIQNGCSAILVEYPLEMLPDLPERLASDVCIIRADSTRSALAEISAARFSWPGREMTVIGITGTKGKTTTAHMVRAILEEAGKKTGIIGTIGIRYDDVFIHTKNTTPESYDIQKYFREMADRGCTHVVMEASSQGFKMHRTDGIVFDYGLFTNLEPDHIGPNEHKDFEEYKYFKSRIFTQSRVGVVNADSPYAEEFREHALCPVYSYGLDAGKTLDFSAKEIRPLREAGFVGTSFEYVRKGKDGTLPVRLDLPGEYNVSNALAALSLCSLMGIPEDSMQRAMEKIKVDGRMETVFHNERMTVLVDYAHNAMGMESLLRTLRAYQPGRLVLVFGCGGNRAKERRYGMGETAARLADFSILTADNSRFERTEDIINDIKSTLVPAGGKYIEIPDRREAIAYAMSNAHPGDMIAVIGKGHEDYNEVNGVRTHFLDREVILEIAETLDRQGGGC